MDLSRRRGRNSHCARVVPKCQVSLALGKRVQSARRSVSVNASLLILCQTIQSLGLAAIALFLPLIRSDLGLSFLQAGSLSAGMNLAYAAVQLPAGYVADRYGAKRLFVVGLLGTSALTLTFTGIRRFPLLLGNQIGGGIFRSLMFAPGLLLISALFPSYRRATAIGLYVIGGFAANILLNILGPLMEPLTGWRGAFVAISAIGVVAVAAFLLWGGDTARPADEIVANKAPALSSLRSKTLWLVGAIQFVRLAVAQGLTFWLPTFLIVDKHLSIQGAGSILAIMAILTVPSTFIGGYLSDRLGKPLWLVAISLAMLGVATLLLIRVEALPLLVLTVCVIGLFVQLYFGPLYALAIEIFGQQSAGFISGFGNVLANLGGVALVFAVGALRDQTGSFDAGFYAVATCCLAGLGVTLWLSQVSPPRRAITTIHRMGTVEEAKGD